MPLPLTLQTNGQLLSLSTPRIMGILNLTPDSFYEASRQQCEADIVARARQIVAGGGDIIDVGACSARPGADSITAEEEMARLRCGLPLIREAAPDAIVSIDTYRADVARMCVEEFGAGIVNDISGGRMDRDMAHTIAALNVPYVLMHMEGTPADMQDAPHYDDLLVSIFSYFSERINRLHDIGVNDIILDPGFGFGKTQKHNYELLAHLDDLHEFGLPLLVGISRKSMVYRPLGVTPDDALIGTVALHMSALERGAHILRVHDVAAAAQTVTLYNQLAAQRLSNGSQQESSQPRQQ